MKTTSFIKYLVMVTMLAAGISLNAGAQDAASHERFEIRLGVSGYPIISVRNNPMGFPSSGHYHYIMDVQNDFAIDELYKDRDGNYYTFGNIGAEFTWNIKRWLAVCAGLYVTPFWTSVYDIRTHARKGNRSDASFSSLAMVRFNYFSRPAVRLYSAIGTGIYADSEIAKLQFQAVPFGVSFGKRVFGFAELGVGTLYIGGNIGVGYRF